jgi:transcriptional regulator with GAF, ATPase, and Fis domain
MERITIQKTTIPDEILGKWQNVVDIMADILTVPSAIVTRVEPPQIEVLRSAQLPGNPYKAGDRVSMAKHYCETVVTENRKLQVSHAPTDPLWNAAPEIEYGMYAYLGLPLCWPNGNMFGTICILDNKENQFGVIYEKVLFEFKELIEAHLSLLDMNEQLKKAMAEVKTLRGMLPICSFCKNIRDDRGYWNKIESYIRQHSEAEFSHSICPKCAKEHYPDLNI